MQYFGSPSGGSTEWGEKKGEVFGVYEGLLVNTTRYVELIYQAVDLLLLQQDMFPAAAAAAAAADSDLEVLLGDGTAEERQKAAEAAKRFDPWKRIRSINPKP